MTLEADVLAQRAFQSTGFGRLCTDLTMRRSPGRPCWKQAAIVITGQYDELLEIDVKAEALRPS